VIELDTIRTQTIEAATELLGIAKLVPGQILVVGCSTSEVIGERIGSSGSSEVAKAILGGLLEACAPFGVWLAIQCCEHLNRGLVIAAEVSERYGLEPVMVIPVPKAGGALASEAMRIFENPVVVENIKAHAGIDIGSTLIGMHLKAVAIPVRLSRKHIGHAFVTAARTRPKLIGGSRAVYPMTKPL
jgi:uncharacterized protein (TIGR01440 family)